MKHFWATWTFLDFSVQLPLNSMNFYRRCAIFKNLCRWTLLLMVLQKHFWDQPCTNLCEMIPNIRKTTIDKILTDRLVYANFYARWVPKILTLDHKQQRIESAGESNDTGFKKWYTACKNASTSTAIIRKNRKWS